jgi:hypothetical protein
MKNLILNYRDSGRFLSSNILKNTMFHKLDLFLFLGEAIGDTYSAVSIRKG